MEIKKFKRKNPAKAPSKIELPKRGSSPVSEPVKLPPEPKEIPQAPDPNDTEKTQTDQSKSRYRGLIPFKPGQSGNPAGKPKGTFKDELLVALEKEARREIAFMEATSGETIKMSVNQLIARALVNKAMKGDTKAIEIYYDRFLGKPKLLLPGDDDGTLSQRVIYLPVRAGSQGPETYFPEPPASKEHD